MIDPLQTGLRKRGHARAHVTGRHPQLGVVFALARLFNLSGVISPLIERIANNRRVLQRIAGFQRTARREESLPQ